MPKLSAILPLYHGINYIEECINSIKKQTVSDWEFIIVSEYGNNDGSEQLAEEYAKSDSRIKIIKNEKRLGLADSLNVGVFNASGEYIARVDADDPSYHQRFEKQVAYLDSHPDVFLCGTLQRSVLPDRSYVQEVPTDAEELKAAMIFGCEISHCSVMFRRKEFMESGLRYNPNKLGEDYDLWTRIMFEHKLVNLPEVLVDHRWGFDNISLEKGDRLKREVCETSAACLKKFDIIVSPEDYVLLSGWRNKPEEFARYNTYQFLYKEKQLLLKLYEQNREKQLIDKEALRKIIFKRWNWACDCAGIFYQKLPVSLFKEHNDKVEVSIVLPAYQAVNTLRETIDSIIVQEFENWELIVVSEAENNDGSLELAEMYAFFDSRIRVIENQEKLGLAESLNLGIKASKTDYIARIDSDDLANAKRIGTQYEYLKNHKDVGICQTYQHYFGGGSNDFIHRPPLGAEEMKAKLLFFCDACHSTVMFRKHILEKYNLWYSSGAALEDYDLWTKLVQKTKFVTLPEVYGEYRVGKQNITWSKTSEIESNMIAIVKNQLLKNLDIVIQEDDVELLNGWNNIFIVAPTEKKADMLQRLNCLLLRIWEQNKQMKYYEPKALLEVLAAKWRWSKYNEPWQGKKNVRSIQEAIELPYSKAQKIILQMKKGLKLSYKIPAKMIQRLHLGIARKEIALLRGYIYEHTLEKTEEQKKNAKELKKEIESWTWERYKRTEKLLEEIKQQNMQIQTQLAQVSYQHNQIPYYKGEKIRIVFLFQIASFWPSWDSFYSACLRDDRMEVRFVFLDETATEDAQMLSARAFLDKSGINYTDYQNFDMEGFNPHVMVIQTPYDNWHRQYEHWSVNFKMKGIRIVYIPYGIEISDTEDSHKLHFQTSVIDSCWRIYTFSERMRQDYLKYALNRNAVRALGLPRFDGLFRKEQFVLDEVLQKRVGGRKIVLWKLHFPKEIVENGKRLTVTPPIEEYIEFAKCIGEYKDLFFIFMPHPRFKSKKTDPVIKKKIKALFDTVGRAENVFVDERDDYRESLANADFIIIDRSAVMVEAGAMKVPVLFLDNKEYKEPVTDAIKPLIKSYYHGTTCQDMQRFIEMCRKGEDPLKNVREMSFRECIPFFDGKCGNRIKEDIIRDLENHIM